jgi:hypothetical protein
MDHYYGVFMKHEIMSIEHLARPMNSACFQAFTIDADILTGSLWLRYEAGGANEKVWYVKSDEVLSRALIMEPTIREKFIELYGSDVDLNPIGSYFPSHMVFVLGYLFLQSGIRFMLLRGSEVSLDSLVQLQDSSPVNADDLT